MLSNNEKRSLLKVLASGSCSAIITFTALTADINAETINFTFQAAAGSAHSSISQSTTTTSSNPLNSGSCLFTAQLASDPALRTAFSRKINAIKSGLPEETDDDAFIYNTNIEAGGASSRSLTEPAKSTDTLSNDCLSCHDGVMAKAFNVRVKNNPNGRVMNLEDIIGGHPVGMEYENYASVNGKEYRGEARFSNEMVFAEGKVGCLTCHNPLNSAKGHLVMNNDRSELCFACHNK
jgi:predicted CXXCH cytochrome family protein